MKFKKLKIQKMSKTLLIASGKGGVGKTTVSINLGLALRNLDNSITLVDGNIKKPNISVFLDHKGPFIHDIFEGKLGLSEVRNKHPTGMNIFFGNHGIESLDSINYEVYMKFLSEMKKGTYDNFVVIDSSPGYSDDFFCSAASADESIVVTTPTREGLHDAKKTIQYCEDEGASVIGIIVNEQSPMHSEFDLQKISDELKRPFLGSVPYDKKIKDSIDLCHPVSFAFPNSKSSMAFKKIGETYMSLFKR